MWDESSVTPLPAGHTGGMRGAGGIHHYQREKDGTVTNRYLQSAHINERATNERCHRG